MPKVIKDITGEFPPCDGPHRFQIDIAVNYVFMNCVNCGDSVEYSERDLHEMLNDDAQDELAVTVSNPYIDEMDHIGRSFDGPGLLEEACPCPKQPCGLVAKGDAERVDCPEHALRAAKTIRSWHAAENCPAKEVSDA